MQSRSGAPPLTIKKLLDKKLPLRKGVLLSQLSPGTPKVGYARGMTTFEEAFALAYASEMAKIAQATGDSNPFAGFENDPEALMDFLKQAGVMDALRGFGKNIAAWGRRGADVISGGDYARQMKELGSASPMSTSAAAGKVVGNQAGPMTELAGRRAAESRVLAGRMSPGGATPLFGAPRAAPNTAPIFSMSSAGARPTPMFRAPAGPSPFAALEASMRKLANADMAQGAFPDAPPMASRLDTPVSSTAGPTSAGGLAVPTDTPVSKNRAKRPSRMASEHAEHLTDLGGLGMMGAASADELREALTGQASLSPSGRELMNLGGLAVMAAPSYAAAKHLQQRGASRKGVAGGGSKFTNYANLAGLTALGLPIVDRLQAKMRGNPEGGRFLSDRQSALMELGGYGALASNLVRAKVTTPLRDKLEHQGLNRQLLGYGVLAAPEAAHAFSNEHPENPVYDAYGNEVPRPKSVIRPMTDLAGLALLGQPVLHHISHSPKVAAAFFEGFKNEMMKLSTVDAEDFERSVKRLEKLESDQPDPTQLRRYAAIGATLGPVASAVEKVVSGDPILQRDVSGKVLKMRSLRGQLGRSVGGAIGAGVIPVVRHRLDRAAERAALRAKIEELDTPEEPKLAEPAWRFTPVQFKSPKKQLAQAQRVGKTTNLSDVPGPSPGTLSKPKGFGKYIPGAKGV